MKSCMMLTAIAAAYSLLNGAQAYAQDPWGLLLPHQRQAYHACLYAAWVEDYCRENSRDISGCIVANGGGRFPLGGRYFTNLTDRYCWYAARKISPE